MNPNLLSQEADIVHTLEKIGLSSEETQVYLSLLKNGPQTVVQLHKRIGLGRNVAYRILDQLLAKQIIEQQLGPRGIIYAAKPATQLKQIVTEKIAQLEATQKELPNLIDKIEAIKSVVPDSRVVYYEGIEGLKQVSYNITRAKDLLRVFEVDHLSDFIPAEFAEKIREELVV